MVADTPFATKTTTPAAPADPLEDESDSSNLTQNVLSEEEWHELLQEVEDEIRRSGTLTLSMSCEGCIMIFSHRPYNRIAN
jgi:hypothetical protein